MIIIMIVIIVIIIINDFKRKMADALKYKVSLKRFEQQTSAVQCIFKRLHGNFNCRHAQRRHFNPVVNNITRVV